MLSAAAGVAAGDSPAASPGVAAPDPSLGEENQFAIQPGGGNLWQKIGGLWVLLGNFKGFGNLGEWSGDATYNPRDVETFSGSAYVSLTTNKNKQPDANPSDWLLLAAKGQDGAVYVSVSSSSVVIGPGLKAFTIPLGRGYTPGQRLRVASTDAPANYMEGPVETYSGTALNLDVDHVQGAGTFASWSINIAGDVGDQGDKGDQGSPGSTYGGTSTSSVTIGTGSKTFVIQKGLAYQAGARVRVCRHEHKSESDQPGRNGNLAKAGPISRRCRCQPVSSSGRVRWCRGRTSRHR